MGGSQNLVEVGDYDQPDHANGKASEAGNEHQASREPDRPRVTPLHRQAETTSHPERVARRPLKLQKALTPAPQPAAAQLSQNAERRRPPDCPTAAVAAGDGGN